MQPDTPQQNPVVPPVEPTPTPEPVATPAPAAQQAPELAIRQTPAVTLSIGDAAISDIVGAGGVKATPQNTTTPEVVQWSAQEYISTDKTPIWYALLGVFVVGGILLDYFFLRTFFTVSMLVVVIAVVLVVMHVRPARMINYTLDSEGLRVDEQLYPLSDYKAFGVIHDGKENSVHLIPIKRFKPSLQVYFPVESGERIVDSLASRLPMEELHLDFVDQIVKIFRL